MYQTMSMAEACGEVEPRGLCFIPGEDFDPHDPEEVEVIKLAMEIDYADRLAVAESEVARLRRLLAERDPLD